jgi:hypothetical protein
MPWECGVEEIGEYSSFVTSAELVLLMALLTERLVELVKETLTQKVTSA